MRTRRARNWRNFGGNGRRHRLFPPFTFSRSNSRLSTTVGDQWCGCAGRVGFDFLEVFDLSCSFLANVYQVCAQLDECAQAFIGSDSPRVWFHGSASGLTMATCSSNPLAFDPRNCRDCRKTFTFGTRFVYFRAAVLPPTRPQTQFRTWNRFLQAFHSHLLGRNFSRHRQPRGARQDHAQVRAFVYLSQR